MEQKLVVLLAFAALAVWGVIVAPFDMGVKALPRNPIPVDAIPDLGENQQIVFTRWPGRSPQDIEDQVTYPLTAQLLGLPGVKTIRSISMFGFSSIYVIFEENVEFYWSRSRLLEKLNSLASGTLPEGVTPALGPDATAMGQIFWYTLEGRTPEGKPTGGWDLHELRRIQDFTVKYALQGASGVAEVASIGGFEQEYQVDVDPAALRVWNIGLPEVIRAVRRSNIDVGARTIEANSVEYVIRGKGFIESVEDLERTVVTSRNGVPITLGDLATVGLGPALRRGALDKSGAEAVGGVVVSRYGANPMETIDNVKARIEEIAPGLPERTLADGTVSKVTVVPFYDRTGLIYETLGTLSEALGNQILITVLVVLLMVWHLRSGVLISAMLPVTVLLTFIMMKLAGVQANVVALGGIAIAIGSVVDMGIVLTENMLQKLDEADAAEAAGTGDGRSRFEVLREAAAEVGGAVMTAVLTTIIGFLPVFAMTGAEGKLFKPLAFTKTFALFASIVIALAMLPPLAHVLLGWRTPKRWRAKLAAGKGATRAKVGQRVVVVALAAGVAVLLARAWEPLGTAKGEGTNLLFTLLVVGGLLGIFYVFRFLYARILGVALRFKIVFMAFPFALAVLGACVWLGFPKVMGWAPEGVRDSAVGRSLAAAFPGLGREFMPPLDEGSFLYMPVTMPHASIGEAMDYLQKLDMAFQAVPEVETVVGKLGRVESSLDPAPVSMFETLVQYKPEYAVDEDGRRVRQWRDEIRTPNDIWNELVRVGQFPGLTSAPKLAPIATRIVMLQSGMRAPMGIKVKGPDLETIEAVSLRIEELLKTAPGVKPAAVVAERIVGKPYLEIDIDREAIARHGVNIQDVTDVIETAIGGRMLTMTVEGRERFGVRVRYPRELRDSVEALGEILVPEGAGMGRAGAHIPLKQLAKIDYVRGPMAIKSEDTFLLGYVLFDKLEDWAEVDVIEAARDLLAQELGPMLAEKNVSYTFAGTWINQQHAAQTLALVLPLALLLIFIVLYLQFRSVMVTLIIFSAVFVAWAGGFLAIWLWGQPWFMNFAVFGVELRELFQMRPVNLSVAVWVGFLALFGIATDDGVVMATYIKQSLAANPTRTGPELRAAVVEAGLRRIRPCLMTSATTILALLPVLSSTGKGAEIMVPMAIPIFGGMMVALLSIFVTPVLYCALEEMKLAGRELGERRDAGETETAGE